MKKIAIVERNRVKRVFICDNDLEAHCKDGESSHLITTEKIKIGDYFFVAPLEEPIVVEQAPEPEEKINEPIAAPMEQAAQEVTPIRPWWKKMLFIK